MNKANHPLGKLFLILLLIHCWLPQAAAAQEPAPEPGWEHPMTPWGDPDLRGMWPLDHINGTPLQRPVEFGERRLLNDEEYAAKVERLAALNARYEQEIENNRMDIGHWAELGQPNRLTSLIVEPANGRLPALTGAGEAKSATMTSSWSDIEFNSVEDFNALDKCITRGLPASMFPFMYNSGVEIRQFPGYVVILLEIIHEARIIPLDGRPPLDRAIRQWMGDSRGHWEGEPSAGNATLVVETTNFNGATPMTIVGPGGKPIPTSTEMRIRETFTRVNDETIAYEVTTEDPVMITETWTAAFPLKRDPGYQMYEYACHEANQMPRIVLGSARNRRLDENRP